ncbi:class I SAM-dependent methyltransferase [Patescibacteria group bacterium]|nr:class I SAM-dependent methyltransferase [Patescibacteria group bacterium]
MRQKTSILEQYNDVLSDVYDTATTSPDFNWRAPKKSNKLLLPYVKGCCKVLDLGIGTGQSSEALYQAGCEITGVDVSQKMIDITQSKFPEWRLYKADIDKEFPTLPNNSFDIIIAVGILEFVENIKRVLQEIITLLKSNGVLCVTFEEYLPESKTQQWKVSELGKGLIDSIPDTHSFYVYRRSFNEMKDIFLNTKLEIIKDEQFIAYFKTKEKISTTYRIFLLKKK